MVSIVPDKTVPKHRTDPTAQAEPKRRGRKRKEQGDHVFSGQLVGGGKVAVPPVFFWRWGW